MEHRARQKYTASAPFFRWMFNACEKARAHADQWPPHIYVPLEAAMEELRSVRLTHSCLNRNKADFLLHRGWFRLGVTAKASAFPSTGRHRGTRGVILQVDRGI